MDTFPPISFVSTLKTEANRILHASYQTARGFYWSKKFAVLPYLVKNNPATVYLPELEYSKISNYWETVTQLSQTNSIVHLDLSPELSKKLMIMLENNYEDISPSVQLLQNQWKQYQDKIIPYLQQEFADQLKRITEIEVRVTAYGTKASFDCVLPNKKAKFSCYIRQDMSVGNIVEALIQGMQYADPLVRNYSWESKEAIVDFILDRAKKQGIIPDFQPTLPGLNSNQELLNKSQKYLEKLGINFEKKLKIENQLIYLNGKIISAQLTSIQHIILTSLIKKQNQIVTFDELADIVWQDDEEFSIWAINKQLQRLRTKLQSLGMEGTVLQSIKGRGYSLQN